MGPDWKAFVEELIKYFSDTKEAPKYYFTSDEIVRIIKNKEIQFLEKSLMKMDLEEGVEV